MIILEADMTAYTIELFGISQMTDFHLKRRTLMALLPAGFLGLFGCGSGGSSSLTGLESDKQFQDMVLRAMPEYRLTSAITGRAVVRSPGYALLMVKNSDSPQTVIRDFLSQFEDTGLPAVDLYFDQFTMHGDAMRVRFPGCQSGGCARAGQEVQIEQVSEQELDRYRADRVPGGIGRYRLLAATVAGVEYEAEVVVLYDYKGRVISYYVDTNRVAINDSEHKWARSMARSDRSHPIGVFTYATNLALGVSAFYDNGPFIEGNSAKGL